MRRPKRTQQEHDALAAAWRLGAKLCWCCLEPLADNFNSTSLTCNGLKPAKHSAGGNVILLTNQSDPSLNGLWANCPIGGRLCIRCWGGEGSRNTRTCFQCRGNPVMKVITR